VYISRAAPIRRRATGHRNEGCRRLRVRRPLDRSLAVELSDLRLRTLKWGSPKGFATRWTHNFLWNRGMKSSPMSKESRPSDEQRGFQKAYVGRSYEGTASWLVARCQRGFPGSHESGCLVRASLETPRRGYKSARQRHWNVSGRGVAPVPEQCPVVLERSFDRNPL
jgi:hypothetical protein